MRYTVKVYLNIKPKMQSLLFIPVDSWETLYAFNEVSNGNINIYEYTFYKLIKILLGCIKKQPYKFSTVYKKTFIFLFMKSTLCLINC